MRNLLLVLFVAATTGCASAQWRTEDTWRHVVFTGLVSIDVAQTIKGPVNDPEHYHERNPLLGEHPSLGKVLVGSALAWTAVTGVAIALPPEYRTWWQYGAIGVEAVVVGGNYAIGLGFGF